MGKTSLNWTVYVRTEEFNVSLQGGVNKRSKEKKERKEERRKGEEEREEKRGEEEKNVPVSIGGLVEVTRLVSGSISHRETVDVRADAHPSIARVA